MPLVFIFFIWYGMYGRNNPKIYSKLHDKFGLIVFLLFIFSGLSSFSSSFGVLLLVSLIIAVVGAPFWLIAWLISKSAKGKARQKQKLLYPALQPVGCKSGNDGDWTYKGCTKAKKDYSEI